MALADLDVFRCTLHAPRLVISRARGPPGDALIHYTSQSPPEARVGTSSIAVPAESVIPLLALEHDGAGAGGCVLTKRGVLVRIVSWRLLRWVRRLCRFAPALLPGRLPYITKCGECPTPLLLPQLRQRL